jgi:GAF domain-containing protein
LRFAFETLTNAFRRARDANDELATMQSSLAERVAARTKDLELAGEIGRYLSRVQESEGILLEAVELIRSRFELYYTQIYLVDTARNNLVLRSGTGAVGHQLRQLGHRLPINGSSINGTAVINKKPVIVSDTTISPIFRQNPLLPETRSEMSVPLIISDNVVGILNLQSVIPNSLTEENLPAFEALAGQLAVALDNARLFSEAAEAQSSVVSLAQRLTRSSWESYLNAIDRQESISFTYDNTQTEFVDGPIDMKNRTSFSVPIRLGGENLGKIEILGNEWDSWGPEDKELAAAIGQRVAQQIENLRLFSETERYRTEAEEATRRLVREGWDSYIEEQETGTDGFQYDQERVTPFPANGQNGKKEANFVQALTVRGEEIGHFEIEGISGSDEEVSDLVGAVAERLSAHIENLRLANQTENALRSTERRAEELAVVNRIAQVISQAMDLDLMLGVILEEISKILPVDAFIVGLYDEEADLL